MLLSINILPFGLSELFAEVTHSRAITQADRYGLMAAVLDDAISEEERQAIDRLLYAMRRGRLQIVNEISTII